MGGCTLGLFMVLLLVSVVSGTEEVNPMVRVIKAMGKGNEDSWRFHGKVTYKVLEFSIS